MVHSLPRCARGQVTRLSALGDPACAFGLAAKHPPRHIPRAMKSVRLRA